MGPNYYDVLGVTRSADTAQIKAAWRKACQQVHPDKGGNNGLFTLVQEAYQTLSDEQRRAAYDEQLAAGTTTSRGPDARGGTGSGPAAGPPGGSQTTVNFADMSWITHVPDSEPEVVVTPGGYRWLPWLSRTLHAVAFILGWNLTFTYNGGMSYDFDLPAFDDFAAIWATSSLASTRHWKLVLPLVLAWLMFGWVDYVAENATEATWFWVWVVAAVGACVTRGAQPLLSPPTLNRLVPVDVVRKFAVFGPAGRPVRRDTLDTQLAARTGAEATFGLTLLPGVRLFHAVTVPGRPGLGADHVVVRGRKVAIVNDVMWNPGTYTFTPLGSLLHNGSQFAYGDVDPRPSVDAWRKQLPKGTQVRSWVLVASASGPVVVDDTAAAEGVRAGTPQQVAEEIGAWFSDDADAATVDRRVLAVFAQGLPSQ